MRLSFVAERPDAPESVRLQQAFLAEIASLYPGFDPARAPSADPDEISPPRGVWVLAYSGQRAVGCGAVKGLGGGIGEVKRVYLEPGARGGGGGRALLAELERRAAELGFDRVRLDTGDNQPGALALFRAAGYEEIEDYNGNPYASHWMEKPL